ncbi:MAG: hypothetical protein GKC10_02700 [Methanosarcinales archaeon]|nr:hypothetical protein [Methanosarcinales archaeon]
MEVSTLFSGGKDSGLTTILLEPFFDEVNLVTFSFGRDEAWRIASDAARELGHPHRTVVLDDEVLERCLELLMKEGYPNGALNYVHRCAVESLAGEAEYIADGTRRDDRAPVMSMSEIRSLEDRRRVSYIRPLAGWGYKVINQLASRYMEYDVLASDKYPASDFEVGLRHVIAERFGETEVNRIFPAKHSHSRVIRRKSVE